MSKFSITGPVMGLPNPHPFARCPYCSVTKAVVTWAFCSRYCADYATVVQREQWNLPDAPVGPDEPEREY